MAPPVPPKLVPGAPAKPTENYSPNGPKVIRPPPYKGLPGPKTSSWEKMLPGAGVATAAASVASGSRQAVPAGPSKTPKTSKASKSVQVAPKATPATPKPVLTLDPNEFPTAAESAPTPKPEPKTDLKPDPKANPKRGNKESKNPVSRPTTVPKLQGAVPEPRTKGTGLGKL
ncbi:uncharacterized protein LOC62_06G008035 [Vanrija pseudolonga]|uniref:Uncharacterized protein n=1 Tax=Vanrija pseudolonga TaxID=143232 RepID=A0AAF0YJ64_9TREE|nr:hypothetical protein LOC62_06G008035 [Vanrija pseudolonga]